MRLNPENMSSFGLGLRSTAGLTPCAQTVLSQGRRSVCRQAMSHVATISPEQLRRVAIDVDISMSARSKNSIKATDFLKRQRRAVSKRYPILSTLVIAVLAGGTAFSTALIGPILWETVRQSPRTYEQCGAVKEAASRLACYDSVSGQKSLHSAKEVRRPPSGAILSEQP